jgi:transcriptional regulator GlxA family with amidase domain
MKRSTYKEEILEITNPPTFLTLINNRLNILQTHDIAQNYKIIRRVVQRLFQLKLKISYLRYI